VGVAVRRVLAAQAGAGDSRLEAAAPGAGAGIGLAAQRARAVRDGFAVWLGGASRAGAQRAARAVRQPAVDIVVGSRDVDHGRLWRRRAGNSARTRGGRAGDD